MNTIKPWSEFAVLSFLLLFLAVTTNSQTAVPFAGRHQAGARLGVWINLGDDIPESGELVVDDVASGSFETNVNSTAFYFEAFYAHRLSSRFLLEGSLGIVNRGSVTLSESGGATDIGNLMIYTLQIHTRFYPLGSIKMGFFYPYISAGGGMILGRRTVQFTNAGYSYANWEEESGTDFNYVVAGGVDIPVAASIALDVAVKYNPVSFSKSLVTIKDYNAMTITVGAKYLMAPQ